MTVPAGASGCGARLGEAPEAALIALGMGGDRRAFSELVWRRQSWLRNLLRRLCRDRTLADDLAQQVFLNARRSLPRLQSVGAFGPWLRHLAINAWLSHVRSSTAPTLPFEGDVLLAATATAASAPGTQLDLDRALARLAPGERLCVVLAYGEGMSHAEISAATSLPLGTVKSHVRRGAERLRTLLHAYEPTSEGHVHAG